MSDRKCHLMWQKSSLIQKSSMILMGYRPTFFVSQVTRFVSQKFNDFSKLQGGWHLTSKHQKCLPCNLLKSLKKKKYVKICEDRPSWHGICIRRNPNDSDNLRCTWQLFTPSYLVSCKCPIYLGRGLINVKWASARYHWSFWVRHNCLILLRIINLLIWLRFLQVPVIIQFI